MADEFDLIAQYFAPLSGQGSLGLTDDAAWLEDAGLVISKDLLVGGTHFFPDDPPGLVARKALRTNISDIAAKGAQPFGYFLGCVFPDGFSEADIELLTEGLKQDQDIYGVTLLGGDTTKHAEGGPLTLSITVLGKPLRQRPVLRDGAQTGDRLFVSGTIGDAGLGLDLRLGRSDISGEAADFLLQSYLLPDPPLNLAGLVAEYASAALDVSDGLLADAVHLARSSGLSLDLFAEDIPLSAAAGQWLGLARDREKALVRLFSAGDDYQILCSVPQNKAAKFMEAAQDIGVAVTEIGICKAPERGLEVRLLAGDGSPVSFGKAGYRHFL